MNVVFLFQKRQKNLSLVGRGFFVLLQPFLLKGETVMAFEPILLNEFGERLVAFFDEEEEDSELLGGTGRHEFCECWISLHEISKTHNAVCCEMCNLRIVIPKEVNTYRK